MMSQARFNSVYSGLTAIAKKVYEAVPIAETWSIPQIIGELERTGFRHEYRSVAGCLATLLNAGLVQETSKGKFCREPIREKTIAPKEEAMKAAPVPAVAVSPAPAVRAAVAVPAPQKSPIDRLGELAARVAAMAGSLKELASDISDAAIDVEAQVEQNEAAMAKVKQLQSILKSLGEP
jgi:hypothetical protein